MSACARLPRIVGQGRASEWLYTGRSVGGEEGERWGFFNRLCPSEALAAEAAALAADLADGTSFANGITKTMLQHQWAMTIEQVIEAEAQALCMQTQDFGRAYDAFMARRKPVGRLALQGPTGCRYLDDPRQHQYLRGGWNLTGDAYRMDADGYFHCQSRSDDMIDSAGYNIAGPALEDTLLRHPAVAECAALGVPDARAARSSRRLWCSGPVLRPATA